MRVSEKGQSWRSRASLGQTGSQETERGRGDARRLKFPPVHAESDMGIKCSVVPSPRTNTLYGVNLWVLLRRVPRMSSVPSNTHALKRCGLTFMLRPPEGLGLQEMVRS